MCRLRDVLTGPAGPVDVSKIEIELLENCRFRWKLYGDSGQLLYCALGNAADVSSMLASTRAIVATMLTAEEVPL